jgi:hypothetical protein
MTRSGITVLLTALLLQAPATRAAPLDKDGCANLKAEQGQLELAGARGNMAKGPQWAKTNLEPDKLEQIRRLLEVDEQLLFRCQGRPLVQLPKEPTDPDPAAREPGTDAAKSAPGVKAPKAPKKEVAKKDPGKQEPAKKKAAAPPANPPAKAQAKQGSGPPPEAIASDKKPAAKKNAKQKADDAYRPPPAQP